MKPLNLPLVRTVLVYIASLAIFGFLVFNASPDTPVVDAIAALILAALFTTMIELPLRM